MKSVSAQEAQRIGDKLKVSWDKFTPETLAEGMRVEHEHDDIIHGDNVKAAKIALAHLKERADYYTQLRKIEKSRATQGYARPVMKHFGGMRLAIETPRGFVRKGTDRKGKQWRIVMPADYGYIVGTRGIGEDAKDAIDIFLGPNKDSKRVFIVRIKNPDTGNPDEDKVFLGFSDEVKVRNTFRRAYDRPKSFFDGIEELSLKEFKQKIAYSKDFPSFLRGTK